ncbi:DUF1700 domain-containing protein [Butyricicoccus pullicaecorum]|uniref:DUF1700 domain-containing protein n=1 Tax=Butyricicoccus pullicaecorum TaxID=501571 RepID=A0A1Y4LTG0_9FIRM|nr:DUF1700 domain-containing protein [Butyricicoccus pullicaecorum]OUP59924.1 hypothetical protein B5F15_03690 [Butyricicoccus pullicaecorum]
MNAYEYLQALRAALAVLPDDEINSAMRYYEDYFLDAGDENAAQVIEQLGPPEQVAEAILRDYTGVARRRPERFEEEKAQTVDGVPLGRDGKPLTRKKGINPWMLACIVLLALIFGPVAITVIGAIIVAVVGLIVGVAACVVAVPAATLIGGGALVLFSFLLWATPASALATLGAGLVVGAIGLLLVLLVIKLCILFVPPIIRGLVALVRWPIEKIRNCLKRGA